MGKGVVDKVSELEKHMSKHKTANKSKKYALMKKLKAKLKPKSNALKIIADKMNMGSNYD